MHSFKDYTLRTSASTGELERIRKFVSDHARQFGFNEPEIEDMRLAVDEACTNVIKHAYEGNSDKEITIRIDTRGNEMLVSIIDEGKSFDPVTYPAPSMQEQLDQKKRSGYGILLIRKLMDKVEYRRRKTRNEIRMIKKR